MECIIIIIVIVIIIIGFFICYSIINSNNSNKNNFARTCKPGGGTCGSCNCSCVSTYWMGPNDNNYKLLCGSSKNYVCCAYGLSIHGNCAHSNNALTQRSCN